MTTQTLDIGVMASDTPGAIVCRCPMVTFCAIVPKGTEPIELGGPSFRGYFDESDQEDIRTHVAAGLPIRTRPPAACPLRGATDEDLEALSAEPADEGALTRKFSVSSVRS